MGKKRVAKKGATEKQEAGAHPAGPSQLSRKKLDTGRLFVQATYNSTKALLTDPEGNAVVWSSSGALGFKGARKGTPFAAAKVGEDLGEKARALGLREVAVVIRGVGSGRESCIRGFIARSGALVASIEDRTPIPFNGPRPPKARRV